MSGFDWFATWRNAGLSWPAPEHPAPDAKRCKLCGQLVGVWNRTHFAKTTDATPCKGSWK